MVDSLFYFQHRKISCLLSSFVRDGGLVLEVGAGSKSRRRLFPNSEFLSVDFTAGDFVQDVTKLGVRDGSVDFVLCENVLEHVFHTDAAIREIHRVLRANGRLFLVTPFLFPLHDAPYDFFRYTEYALSLMLKDYSRRSIHRVLLLPFMNRLVLYYVCLAEK